MPVLAFVGGHGTGGLAIDPWAGLVLGLFLVALNGFFVAAEFALVKVRPTQLDPWVAQGSVRGRRARHMVRHLDAYLSATQLGITLASLALGWIGEPAFEWIVRPLVERFGPASPETVSSISLVIAFLVITILHIVLGELAPKSMAIRKPEASSLWIAIPLHAFYRVSYPAIWVLNHAANAILRIFGIEPVSEHEIGHDEEELRRLLASSHPTRLSEHKQELLDNIFELSHRTARQIMVPRTEVVYLSTTDPLETSLERARESGHTRFPLCEGDLDEVLGLIHIKDIFRAAEPFGSLAEISRPITFVPETLELDRLLRRMRRERVYMTAVLDEYGGVSGLVTLENVVEEIVGEIQDEFDMEDPEIVRLSQGVYDVDGSVLVRDLESALEFELSDRDEDTIAGVVLSEIGRSPEVGDRATLGSLKFEIREIDRNRIRKLRIRLATADDDGAPDSARG